MLIDVLNKLNGAVIAKIAGKKKVGLEEELRYVNSLREPIDDIDRSYHQYKCSSFVSENKMTLTLKNAGSLLGVLIYIFIKCRKKPEQQESVPFILVFNGTKVDIVPDKYIGKFFKVPIAFAAYLTKQDKQFIREIWNRHPLSFYFLLKCVVKVATYRAAIETYHPQHILCSCEYSFTSSIMTLYCENMDMKHINLMHGLVSLSAGRAFHRFSISSIWAQENIEIFKMLRADADQYEIEIPKCLRFKINSDLEQKGTFKYYLQDTTDQVLEGLANLYGLLQKKGILMIFRPHPRYSNLKKVKSYIPNAEIENADEVDIEVSINQAEYIIARHSTVLLQAQLMNKKVIIDDVSMPEEYEQLKMGRTFFWATEVKKMSEFLNNSNEDGF